MKNLKLEGLKNLSKDELVKQARLYEIKINGLKNRVKRFKEAEDEFRSLIKILEKKSKLQDKLIEGYKRKAEEISENTYAFDIAYKDLIEYFAGEEPEELFATFDSALKHLIQNKDSDLYIDVIQDFSHIHSLLRDILFAKIGSEKEPAA